MRYSRKLRRVFYLSARASMMREGPTCDHYLKNRGEGLKHVQALIALARRCIDVFWALLRNNRVFEITPPTAPHGLTSFIENPDGRLVPSASGP